MARLLFALVLILLAGGWRPAPAEAQETPAERARALSKLGLEAVDSGDFQAAVEFFRKAYRVSPEPRYLYNVGRAYHVMGKFRLALQYYERFLDENSSPKKAARAQETIDEVKRQLARLVVAVEQEGVRLEVDGDKELCLTNRPCLLDPGEHRIEVTATGFAGEQRRVRLESGELRRETIVLVAVLTEELPTRGGAVWRSSLFPGMGQFYAGNRTAGFIFLTSELVALATMTTGIILEQYYVWRRSNDNPSHFRDWDSALDASNATWIGGLTAAAAIWAVNIVHASAIRLPGAGAQAGRWLPLAMPTGNGLSLTISF